MSGTTPLEKLDRGDRIVSLYVNAQQRQKLGGDHTNIHVGYGYLRELLKEPSDNRICASDDCQHWKITIIELAPVGDGAINNTVGLKLDQSVHWWIAEIDLPKSLRIDAKQKDLFTSDPTDDPTDDLKATRPKKSASKKRTSGRLMKSKSKTAKATKSALPSVF